MPNTLFGLQRFQLGGKKRHAPTVGNSGHFILLRTAPGAGGDGRANVLPQSLPRMIFSECFKLGLLNNYLI